MPDGEFDWGGRLRKGIGGAPVSYTHLDVYKRQGIHLVPVENIKDAIRFIEKGQV